MKILALIVVLFLNLFFVSASLSRTLESDLSTHQVAITSSYAGKDLVFFGTREGSGNIVIILKGPDIPLIVRKKERVLGLWLNKLSVQYKGIPGYYAIASNSNLDEIFTQEFLVNQNIGLENLSFSIEFGDTVNINEFSSALIKNRQKAGLFSDRLLPVEFTGEKLFRAEFQLPASAPIGEYVATAYLIEDGTILDINEAFLRVTKSGIGRKVFNYSRQQPALYGLLAVVLALITGWAAAAIFQRN